VWRGLLTVAGCCCSCTCVILNTAACLALTGLYCCHQSQHRPAGVVQDPGPKSAWGGGLLSVVTQHLLCPASMQGQVSDYVTMVEGEGGACHGRGC
jgi:hypothetical protein